MTTQSSLNGSSVELTIQEIIERIRPHLSSQPIKGHVIEIVDKAVHRDDDWWYVPVRLNTEMPRTWQYYDTLIEIEDEIARDEHLKVLFVPSG